MAAAAAARIAGALRAVGADIGLKWYSAHGGGAGRRALFSSNDAAHRTSAACRTLLAATAGDIVRATWACSPPWWAAHR